MGFWIFMLVIGLLIPAVMIVFGRMFAKSAPKKINYIFGYRTDMSMKNQDTWDFAHKYIGRLWLRLGFYLVPIAIIPMLFVIGKSEDIVGAVGLTVGFADMIVLIVPIFLTEAALKKNFDRDGKRKAG